MRFIGLDGLRGLMCLWVVIGHSLTMAGIELDKDSFLGKIIGHGLAVDVFFIISGFVITLLLLTKEMPYTKYLRQRALRIFPVYLVFLVFSALILNQTIFVLENFPFDIGKTSDRLKYADASLVDLGPHLVTHLFMLHGIIPTFILNDASFAIMGQAWSLTLQCQFFILAPFFVLILRKNAFLLVFAILIIMTSSQLTMTFMGHSSFFFANSYMFFVGMISAIFIHAKKRNKLNNNTFYILLVIFLLLGFLYQWLSERFLAAIPILIWSTCFFIEVSAKASLLKELYKVILTNRLSLFLGRISYSMYCCHMIFLYVTSYILITNHTEVALYTPVMLIVPFIFTILISFLSYQYIEKYFTNFGKAKKNNIITQRAI